MGRRPRLAPLRARRRKSPQTWQRVKTLYAAALELPTGQRDDYLRQQAAEEPRVLTEALRLLRYEDAPSARLDALQVPSGLIKRGSLLPGQRLTDRYEIRRFIALVGFGEVYEADDLERGERIAVKLFRPEFATADHLSWLRREVQLARRVQHPNICRVFDFVQGPQSAFLTMELLDGETFAAYLRREGALSERRALPLVRQIVAALAAAPTAPSVSSSPTSASPAAPPTTAAPPSPTPPPPPSAPPPTWPPSRSPAALPAPPPTSTPSAASSMKWSPLALAIRKTSETPTSPTELAPSLRPTWERCILRCLQPRPEDRLADVREVLTFLDSRSSSVVAWKLARRSFRRHPKLRNILLAVAAAAALVTVGFNWPQTPTAAAIQAWEKTPPSLTRAQTDLALAPDRQYR